MSDEIKQCLIDLDYPNVASLNEDDIFSLFSKENILKFYRWIVGELLSNQTMASTYKDSEVVNILYNFGYCKKRQREGLIKGYLDFEEQHDLILRMLDNLTKIKKSTEQDAHEIVTIDELNELITKKFVSLSDANKVKSHNKSTIQACDLDETIGQDFDFDEYATTLKEQIQELEERLKAADDEPQVAQASDKNNVSDIEELEELPTVINKFLLSTSNLTDVQSNIDLTNETKMTGKFSEDFTKTLVECSKNILDLEEYFTNLNIVEELNGDVIPIEAKESSECSESAAKLLKLVESL